jgi:5-methylcytosine-specific restriction endonuclease McrA
MKIGQLVKQHIPQIIEYCLSKDIDEVKRLSDEQYSKETFDLIYPFWRKVDQIEESKRYWKDIYTINGEQFRVSNHWFVKQKEFFERYLIMNGVVTKDDLKKLEEQAEIQMDQEVERKIKSTSGRYRNSAIGNAQNLLIRNILSNLGYETFNEEDWIKTKEYFDHRCAYCGAKTEQLVMEHAIPINKTKMGEHKLGNLVPSCHRCNQKKGSKSYDEFLNDGEKIKKIEKYMEDKRYFPLYRQDKSEIIEEILEMAYRDTAEVAKRYIKIIESIL